MWKPSLQSQGVSLSTPCARPFSFNVDSKGCHTAETVHPTAQILSQDVMPLEFPENQDEMTELDPDPSQILTPRPSGSQPASGGHSGDAGRSYSLSSISTDGSFPYRALPEISWTASADGRHCRRNSKKSEETAAHPQISFVHAYATQSGYPILRKRGRPRKEPILSPVGKPKKEPRNRTKTGCITCRKRKKKCPEERPVCMNCQKNNYACVYPETEMYRTGVEKADEDARRASFSMPRPLPSLFEGVESSMDRLLLHHFLHNCSPALSMNSGGRNLYLVHLLPMAVAHGPLMHGMLALSASHLSYQAELGKIARDPGLIDHQYMLHSLAIRGMRQGLTNVQGAIDEQTIAINLVAILYTIAQGQANGEYQQHLAAAKTMCSLLKSDSEEFCDFIYETTQYHGSLSALLSIKGQDHLHIPAPDGLSYQPKPQLLGVYCDLLSIVGRISQIRAHVRRSLREKGKFAPDVHIYAEATDIDVDLRAWEPSFPKPSDKWLAGQVCQRAAWAYLRRTMTFPSPGPEIKPVLEDAMELFDRVSEYDTCNTCLLYPVFLLGCCAFDKNYRAHISAAFDRLEDYTGMRNARVTREFVKNLWDKMDSDVCSAWDWEGIAEATNMDFLVA